MNLHGELTGLLGALEARGAAYALAGGLALAVHGVVRATEDIDLLVPDEELESVAGVARELGFGIETRLAFASGLEILRLAKVEGDDALVLDLLRVDATSAEVFRDRIRIRLEGLEVQVVSRRGLELLKLAAGREQDLADLARLRELDG